MVFWVFGFLGFWVFGFLGCFPFLVPSHYPSNVMFSMFVLWVVVFAGIFRRARWTIPVAVATMIWSLVLLKLHMTDPIPLNF